MGPRVFVTLKVVCSALLLQLVSTQGGAQITYRFDQSIPVESGGRPLIMPWAGGLNSAQVNTIDLNQDGIDDLAIFDRPSNKIFTYLNIGNQYSYAPDYESYFPSSIGNWVLLRDFNCDGKKDLFTKTNLGISVFVNITKQGGVPEWRPFNKGTELLTTEYNLIVNIQINGTDIPAIDDIDEDGDLDVIVPQFFGVGSMAYYKNMSMEKIGRCDSMQMQFVTNEWGNFIECNCGRFAFSGIDCSQVPIGGRTLHDAGKSLLTLDLDNDGLHDLLFSEQNCTSLYLLPNQGTTDTAKMNSYKTYPVEHPSALLFPAAYHEDLDFDGVKDLAISTNIGSSILNPLDLSNSIWFYKNTGTDALPQFSFQKANWLQDQMIDAGSYSSPAFADYDSDGDLDLFVSYWAKADSTASIYQYENIGNFYTPSFRLVTDDYQQFSKLGFFNIKIQFADINADGRKDLIFTATDKKQLVTNLYFLKNQGSADFDFSGQAPEKLPFHLDQLENVFMYDVNRDGLLDILVGRSDGSLHWRPNAGSASNIFFGPGSTNYMGLGSSISRYCMSPTVADLRHDGKPDLLVSNRGSIVVYQDFQYKKDPPDTIFISNSLKELSEPRKLGTYLLLTTSDLYADSNPLVVVGTITGGLFILKGDSALVDHQENMVSFWPNPVGQNQSLNVRTSQNSSVQFFTTFGQALNEPIPVPSGETTSIIINLSPGLYFARISWRDKSRTIKLIVK